MKRMPYKNDVEFTTIGIRRETALRIRKLGIKGELYDDILNRVLSFYEKHYNKK